LHFSFIKVAFAFLALGINGYQLNFILPPFFFYCHH
jgi:hypothetical protein